MATASSRRDEVINVSIEEADRLIREKKDLLILDVSLEEDYKHSHMKNSVSIPYKNVREAIPRLEDFKDKEILLYCKTGRGSGVAAAVLAYKGFKRLYHMYEGFTKWSYEKEQSLTE